MIVSLNEVETTILKAARGAGMSWGLAEEAAQAARWLAARRLAFEPLFVQLFEAEAWRTDLDFDGRCLRPRAVGSWLCPIRAGAFLSDLGDRLAIRVERLLCPMLLVPFAARFEQRVELAWEGATLHFDGGGGVSSSTQAEGLDALQVAEAALRSADGRTEEGRPIASRQGGVAIDMAAWSKLQNFEARVYVPASLESRQSGAGAALDDND
jgi:hypothetical protein